MRAKPEHKTIGNLTFEDRFPHLQDDNAVALQWQWDRDREARAAAEASPSYHAVRERLLSLGGSGASFAPRRLGGKWFGFATIDGEYGVRVGETPTGPGRFVISSKSLATRVVGDPEADVMLTWMEPSPTGKYLAVAWSLNGQMNGKWSVFDTSSGEPVAEVASPLYTGARPGWLPDDSGFWLDGYDDQGQHRLRFVPVEGTPVRPDIVLPHSLVDAKHSGVTLQVSPDGRFGVAVTEPHEHVALVLVDLHTLQTRPFLPAGWNGECDGRWLDATTYVARISGDTPRGRVVAIQAHTSTDPSTWRELVPASDAFMSWATVIGRRLYVGELLDVALRVRVFDLEGRLHSTLPLQGPGSAPSLFVDRSVRPTESLAFTYATFTHSPVLMVHDANTGELRQLTKPEHRLPGVIAEQRFVASRDGTRIPYFLVHRPGPGIPTPRPTLVNAYGGFNVAMVPSFQMNCVPFIEAGGVYVLASLRGGSEYGKAWHDGGRLQNKQNTFDDLRAVGEDLIASGVSDPSQMAFQGVSNGGLLAGVAIVQQPDLWRAVAPVVPVFDMLEPLPVTAATAGVRAIFYEDYGDPAEPGVAQRIARWSPYHNITDGVDYPAVFQVFGENDVACMPFHGRKFTARLDEAKASPHPIHLRVWRDTGHGTVDPVKAASQTAEWLAFVMDQVGLKAAGLAG